MIDSMLDQLKDLIIHLQTDKAHGTRLPTERELAQSLDIQRSTLRERLAVLEVLGFIQRTQGSGTYLTLPDSAFFQLYFEIALLQGYFSIEQLSAARELLEHSVAQAAALHANDQDIAELEEALVRILAAGNNAEVDAAEHQFHLRLARATHNPVIVLVSEGISTLLFRALQQRREQIRNRPDASARMNAIHAALITAIRARDSHAAEAAMEQQVRVWNEEI